MTAPLGRSLLLQHFWVLVKIHLRQVLLHMLWLLTLEKLLLFTHLIILTGLRVREVRCLCKAHFFRQDLSWLVALTAGKTVAWDIPKESRLNVHWYGPSFRLTMVIGA